MGAGKFAYPAPKGPRSRSRLRANPRPSPKALQSRRDWRGNPPEAVPAAGPGLLLRKDLEGTGPGESKAGLAGRLGQVHPKDTRRLREPHEDGDPSRNAPARILLPPSRGEAESDTGRTGEAGCVHGIHRTLDTDLSVSLPHAGRLGRLTPGPTQRFGRCPICRRWAELTLDHILPKKFGGNESPSNVRWICRSCNSIKGSRLLSDDQIRWYIAAQILARRLGVGVRPPGLGFVGPGLVLGKLLEFSLWRARPLDE